MKKSIRVAWMVAFLVVPLFASGVQAADDAAKQQALLAAKKLELNGHEWEMKISSAGAKGIFTTDTLTFKDMKFESQSTAVEGFKPTNYTISLQEGGPSIWETMQSDEKGAVIFWRGEWEGESMHGVMSKQSDGKSEDFYFSSVSSKPVEDTPKVVEPVIAEVSDMAADVVEEGEAAMDEMPEAVEAGKVKVPAAVPAEEQQPKKKKSWF